MTSAVIKIIIKYLVEHGQILGFAARLYGHVNKIVFTALMCCSWCNGVKVGNEIRELLFSLPRMVEDQVRPVLPHKLSLSSCTLYGRDGDLCDSTSQKCLLRKSWM